MAPSTLITGIGSSATDGQERRIYARGSILDDKWDADQANRLLRETLEGIGELEDKLSPARAEALLDEFERSGLSGPKFAALVGIKYQTFAAWSARRRKLTCRA